MSKVTWILKNSSKSLVVKLSILALLVMSVCGCAQEGSSNTANVSEAEYYAQLTESDKQLYNNLLLKVLPQFTDLSRIQISSIRVGTPGESGTQMYYILLVQDTEAGDSEEYFYAFGNVDGISILVPVSFQNDPTEWDFAEESKYDITRLNSTIHAHARELTTLNVSPTNLSADELRTALNKCRTFFYKDGEIEGDHVITRIDLENGSFSFTTMTSKGIRTDDRILDFSKEGSYDVEISSDNIAYLVLDGWEKCPIQFDKQGNIWKIRATGYKNFAGEVAVLNLSLTDTW